MGSLTEKTSPKTKCPRCESVGRKPGKGVHLYVRNKIRVWLCEECHQEIIDEEEFLYEIEEDEGDS